MGGSFLALVLLAGAQEPPAKPPLETTIEAGDAVAWQQGDATVTFLSGVVTLRRQDFDLKASRAIVWRSKGAKSPIDAIYAEGNVIFTQGQQQLRAERFYYSLAEDKGVIIELRARGFSADLKQTFHIAAKAARMTTLGRLQAEDVSITSCPYGVPHYHLGLEHLELQGENPRERRGPGDLWPFQGANIDVSPVTVSGLGAPLFFLPGLHLGSWAREFPLRSLQYGNSSRFGHTLETDWGFRLRKEDPAGKPRTVADVRLEADYREKRGWGGGLDVEYGWDPARVSGFLDSYFLHDQGRDLEVEFELKFPPLDREERGKTHVFHRQDLADAWRYELEAYWLSDRSFQEEFFRKEFKENKEPESAAYVRWLEGPWGGYLLERHRLNDFQTQNEYLPRVDLWLQPVAVAGEAPDNLYVSQRLDVAHVRRRFDEDLHLSPVETWRVDSTSEVMVPFDLTWLTISPFGQYRATLWEDDLDGDNEVRSMWTAGARAVAALHGTFPLAELSGVGLRGLRHVAEIEARYANVIDARGGGSDVFPFEEVDQLGEFEEVALELRQRFKTKDAEGKPFEFLSAVVSAEYYPDSDRDAQGPSVSNVQDPFSWIGLPPQDPSVAGERRHWSNLHYQAEFHPRSFFSLSGLGEWNPVSRHEEVRESQVTLRPIEGLAISAGHMFVRGVTDAWSGGVAWVLTPKWSAGVAAQYDFSIEEYISQNLVLSRDFHDFLLQRVVERDFARDDDRVYVTFVPKFLSLGSRFKSSMPTAGAGP